MAAGSIPITAAIPAPDPNAQLEQLRELLDTLNRHVTQSETRHQEIIDGVNECQLRLDRLSAALQTLTTANQTESPQLTQALTQISELRGELQSLVQAVQSLQATILPRAASLSPSGPSSEVAIVTPESATVESAAVVETPASPKAKPRRLVLR